jgi:hypothetical protein
MCGPDPLGWHLRTQSPAIGGGAAYGRMTRSCCGLVLRVEGAAAFNSSLHSPLGFTGSPAIRPVGMFYLAGRIRFCALLCCAAWRYAVLRRARLLYSMLCPSVALGCIAPRWAVIGRHGLPGALLGWLPLSGSTPHGTALCCTRGARTRYAALCRAVLRFY